MLKKLSKRLITATAVTLFTSTAHAAYVDIALNGGFESGNFSGWTVFPGSSGPAGQEVSNVNPASGNFSGHLTEFNPAANIIKQANLLPGQWTEGQQIDIEFDIRGTAEAGAVLFAEFFSELTGGGTSSNVFLGGGPLFPNANPDVWTHHSYSAFVGPDSSGGITLQFNAACAPIAGCNSDYYIDNVTISADVSAVPVPAAVWLFGSGLIGLVGVARKRKVGV